MNFLKNLPHEIEQLIYSYDDTYKPTMNPKNIWCKIHTHVCYKARKRIFKKYDFKTAMKICFCNVNTLEYEFNLFNRDVELTKDDFKTLEAINKYPEALSELFNNMSDSDSDDE